MPVNNDDILFDEWTDEETTSTSDISLDSEDVDTTTEESNVDKTSETEDEVNQIDETKSEEEDDEDIDLDALFAELEDASKTVDKIEENKGGDNTTEVSELKQTLNNMEQLIKKLSNDKADLIYKNAELEAFGSDWTDPQILLLSRNLTKSKDGDDKAKTKSISILKDMLYDLTWEDYDQSRIDKDIDLLTATENYNSVSNPNLKSWKKQEDDWLSI